jgi:hypothetical protein
MNTGRPAHSPSFVSLVVFAAGCFTACSSDPSPSDDDTGARGGSAPLAGSNSGGKASGGSAGRGGAPTAGASPAGGTGGTTGGTSASGGAAASAGTGGSAASGGATSGGTTSAGGTGGGAGSSGAPGMGGSSGAGDAGSSSGGVAAGGAGAGGATTGGTSGSGGQGPTTDVEAYFAGLRCGAHYTALGDGGWTFCLRLADGGGACTSASGSEVFQRATFQGGGAINNVAQISGINDNGALVVTAAGALHYGNSYTAVATAPLIASGVVNVTAGRNARAALVRDGAGFAVMGWTGDGTPARIALPSGVMPMQVSANYGIACALDATGAVYCWEAGGNHDLGVTTTPSKMDFDKPLKMISVGQNTVCGVSFSNTLECKAGWYSSPWLPTEGMAPNFSVRQSTFPMVRTVHAGYHYGIIVRADGAAFYLGDTPPGMDNPGMPFTGATDVVAAGGDRGNACVLTAAGSVYCNAGGTVKQATLGGSPLQAAAAPCMP